MAGLTTVYPQLLVVVFCLVLLALVSAAETAMISVNKVRIRTLAEAGHVPARLVDRITDDRQALLSSLIVLINGCLLVISAFSTDLFLRLFEAKWLPLLSLGMILVILTFFEVTPKALALRHAERAAFLFARPLAGIIWLLSPLIWVMAGFGRAFLRSVIVPIIGGEVRPGTPPLTDEEIKQLLEVGEEVGELEAEEREMLYSAIEFADKVAREVMRPRTDLVCVPESATVSQAVQVGIESGFSRLPVYRGDLDHIVGILYMRDLLPRLLNGAEEVTVPSLMRPPFFVPESKKVDELLRDMQGRRIHLAIVIDEYGGVAGLVTIEDLLEEIVGEIRDEYDIAEEEPFRMIDENTAMALARVSPDEIAEHFDVSLPEGEFDSLGGFIIAQLGRLPEAGEVVEYGPLTFAIESVEEQRIERIRVTRREEQHSTDEET